MNDVINELLVIMVLGEMSYNTKINYSMYTDYEVYHKYIETLRKNWASVSLDSLLSY